MKKCSLILITLMMVFYSLEMNAQNMKRSKKQDWPMEEKHISINNFPADKMINYLDDWGGMTIAVNSIAAGTDLAPLLVGLKNNSCQVPHWGYIIQGKLSLLYDNGSEVILKTGDLFYMSPGHKGKVLEDVRLLDFSPEQEFKDLVTHLEKMAAELSQANQP